jgi:hypothetical protein
MLRRAAWVTAVAGRLGVPVVVTEEDAAVNGSTAEVLREVSPEAAPVLPKWIFGAPGNPVAHSALGFKEFGKPVVAVHDALFSPGGAHANGLGRMERAGVELVSTKELAYDWLRTVTGLGKIWQTGCERRRKMIDCSS